MKRERKTTGKPRRWMCRVCPAQGYDTDPRWAWEQHYMDTHHNAYVPF